MTKENLEHLEAIQDIRQMMKKSTRFLSLSGLSGVFAGLYALIGAYVASLFLNKFARSYQEDIIRGNEIGTNEIVYGLYLDFILIAAGVLVFSIITAYFFFKPKGKTRRE